MSKKEERVEFTEEQKAAFVAQNTKVNFWMDKVLAKEFDLLAKEKGLSRKEAIIKLMHKFVEKNKK
jgi:metal-responsive CopG/Arc/MetJ family transcriptional regulator